MASKCPMCGTESSGGLCARCKMATDRLKRDVTKPKVTPKDKPTDKAGKPPKKPGKK